MKKNKKPVIFSLFSGLGFLDLGFEKAGFPIVLVNEYEKAFIEGYRYARERMRLPLPKYGFLNVSAELLSQGEYNNQLKKYILIERRAGNPIGFIAGPPCPDFSVGGKNKGYNGENGRLTKIYFELICQFKPDFFVFENVKGLYKTKKHKVFFEEMKNCVIESDYLITEKLVNSLVYGVPQNRERIILLGFKKKFLKARGIKFNENEVYLNGNFPWRKFEIFKIDQKRKYLWPKKSPFKEDGVLEMPEGIIKELTVEHWFRINNVLLHENACKQFQVKAAKKRFEVIEEGDDSRKSYKRLHRWRYSPTASYGNNEVHLHPYMVRRLSVAEALAIQSLPKDFILPNENMTLTQMFKGVGNGVPYLLSLAIAKSTFDFLEYNTSI